MYPCPVLSAAIELNLSNHIAAHALAFCSTQGDPDDPDAANVTSVHDAPGAENMSSLQRQLIGI